MFHEHKYYITYPTAIDSTDKEEVEGGRNTFVHGILISRSRQISPHIASSEFFFLFKIHSIKMSLILTAPYQRSKTYLDWYPGRIVLVCNREEHKLGSIDRCHDGLTWLILERGMNQDYHLPRFMTMCVLLSRATFAHRRVKKNRVRAWICNFISTVGHFRYLSFVLDSTVYETIVF